MTSSKEAYDYLPAASCLLLSHANPERVSSMRKRVRQVYL